MSAAGNKNMEVFLPAQTASGYAGVSSAVGIRPTRSGEFLCYFLSSVKESR